MKPKWLYRTVESDQDGDPLDFGVVEADTFAAAQRSVALHLRDVLGEEQEIDVYFYPVSMADDLGIWQTTARKLVTLTMAAEK